MARAGIMPFHQDVGLQAEKWGSRVSVLVLAWIEVYGFEKQAVWKLGVF